MKRTLLILAMFVVAVLPSCKRSMTEIKNPGDTNTITEAANSFETEFQAIWEAMNQSYVLWDYDTVDWDARRDKMIDLGKKFDQMEKEGSFVFYEHCDEIADLFYGLLDHHLSIVVKSPYGDGFDLDEFSPGKMEVMKRAEYHDTVIFQININALNKMHEDGLISVSDEKYGTFNKDTYFSCIINNSIPYLRMTRYGISGLPLDTLGFARDAVDSHFRNVKTMKENGTLKGIILDNRGNIGGYQNDANYVVGPYLTGDMTMLKSRTKNGLGKYDYSLWTDKVISPYTTDPDWYVGDLGNIPYVAMEDMNSVSMGEITGSCVAQLNSGIIIGERSRGGHGGLNQTLNYEQQGWCGIINYYQLIGHGLFNPLMCCKIWNNHTKQFEMQEGVGLIPNIEVKLDLEQLYAGYDNQLMRAIEYINNGK